ncbi:MAG: hypothetical protein HOY78_02090 [Saccharothrix sp.]|nr:hypothetical protein [Saccharothrix sp.]
MNTTLVDPLTDPDVLTGSCPNRRCVLNKYHRDPCRTHYRAGDRVLQTAGFTVRSVRGTVEGERCLVRYLKAVTPCCGASSWEAADHFTWREEHGFRHDGRRCGYRLDRTGRRNGGREVGCGWWWEIERIHPERRAAFLAGEPVPIVWTAEAR